MWGSAQPFQTLFFLRKYAILFDKVICEGITLHVVNNGITTTRQDLMEEAEKEYAQEMPELRWLEERGVVTHVQNALEGSQWQAIYGVFEKSINEGLVSLDPNTPYEKIANVAVSVYERSMAIELQKLGIEAVSLSPAPDTIWSINEAKSIPIVSWKPGMQRAESALRIGNGTGTSEPTAKCYPGECPLQPIGRCALSLNWTSLIGARNLWQKDSVLFSSTGSPAKVRGV